MTITDTDKSIDVDTIQPLGPGNEPLFTGDGVLAFSMYMAGTPFVDEGIWCVNYYTSEILRKLGYGGLSMREGAKQAVKDGRPGVVRFLLARPDNNISEAYREQEREIEQGEGLAHGVLRRLLDDYKSGALSYGMAAARIVCLLLKMRIQFMNGWKEVVPLLRIDSVKEPQQRQGLDGNLTVELGGFKLISVNASEKIRERMGL